MAGLIATAMKRGFSRRCPACGKGPLFRGYVKVREHCPVCGEDNGRHRVDDAASYFTVLLVGHVVVAPALFFEVFYDAPLALLLGLALPGVGVVTLSALPFIKGAVLGALSGIDRSAKAKPSTDRP